MQLNITKVAGETGLLQLVFVNKVSSTVMLQSIII